MRRSLDLVVWFGVCVWFGPLVVGGPLAAVTAIFGPRWAIEVFAISYMLGAPTAAIFAAITALDVWRYRHVRQRSYLAGVFTAALILPFWAQVFRGDLSLSRLSTVPSSLEGIGVFTGIFVFALVSSMAGGLAAIAVAYRMGVLSRL